MDHDKQQQSTTNLVETLQGLDGGTSNSEEKVKENRTMCRLLSIHLKEFFDDIYIPFGHFRNEDWKIAKVLYNNEDVLFFNEKYLTKDDEPRFYEVFNKYVSMIEDIFTPSARLYIFLKKWTDMSQPKWRSYHNKTFLKTILTDNKYQYISPVYTTELFCQLIKKNRGNEERAKEEVEDHLIKIVSAVNREQKKFGKIYNEIVSSYVFDYPMNSEDRSDYIAGFINSVIIAILDFSEKLIELNVYAVHPFVVQVIGYYTPLDEIGIYDPADNGNRQLYIV